MLFDQWSIRAKLLLLAGVPVLSACVLAVQIWGDARDRQAAGAGLGSIEDVANLSLYLNEAITGLQRERALTALGEAVEGDADRNNLMPPGIGELRSDTDRARRGLDNFLAGRSLVRLPKQFAADLADARQRLAEIDQFRARVDSVPLPLSEVMTTYGGPISSLLHATVGLSQLAGDGDLVRGIGSLVATMELTERTSRQRALVAHALALGHFPPGSFKELINALTEEGTYRQIFVQSATAEHVRALDSVWQGDAAIRFVAIRSAVIASTDEILGFDADAWDSDSAWTIDGLRDVGSHILRQVQQMAADRSTKLRRAVVVGVGLSVVAILISTIFALVLGGNIGGRVATLAVAAERVRGTKDYSVRVANLGRDELGALAVAINEMLAHVQIRDDQLAGTNTRIESEVRERTKDLVESREQYRTLLESTRAVPWEMDSATARICYVGPQATALLGFPLEAWLTEGFFSKQVCDDDRERVREMLEGLSTGREEGAESEFRMTTAGGREVWLRSFAHRHVSLQGGSRVGGILLDVTERKNLETDLRQAQKLEAIGRLAAGIAHEINTPIQFVSDSVTFVRDATTDLSTVVHAYRQALQESGGAMPAAIAEAEDAADLTYLLDNVPKALDRALGGLDRIATIVRAMKQFAHADQQEMSASDLNQAVSSTVTIATNEFKHIADVDLVLGDIPAVTCHLGEINQVILNLIVNAAHAIDDVVRGSERRGKITIRSECDGDFVVLSVGDTGTGIPIKVRDRVFDPFFTTKGVGKGSGQGLAIAYKVVVEKHHGAITFDTELGKGTTFFLRLPINQRKAA